MTPAPTTTAEWLSRENGGVRRLSILCSLAARVEPQLLRVLRLRLARGCSAGDEALLWSAPIVQSTGATGFMLKPDAQRRLQDELRDAPGNLLDSVWHEIFSLRTGRTWPDDLNKERSWFTVQEELTYLALKGFRQDSMETTRAERLVAQVANTIGRSRNPGASWWAETVLVRMPPDLFSLPSARRLLAELAADQPLWVRLVTGGVELSFKPLDQGHAIDAPLLRPLAIEVNWQIGTEAKVASVSVPADIPAFLPLPRGDVRLKLLNGSVWELRPAAGPILINVPPPPEVFVDREREAAAALDALLASPPATREEEPERPLRMFVSYERKDAALQSELETVLKRLRSDELIQVIQASTTETISPGDDWKTLLEQELRRADVILFLVSPDWLASDWCRYEMDFGLSRAGDGSALAIPIIGRECDWQSTPLAKLETLPRHGQPIAAYGDTTARSMAWIGISEELDKILLDRRRELAAGEEAGARPLVVGLVGPAGIGTFTLARRLAHEPAVRERYPDGILWLGEDGSGYPRWWLRDYCQAVSVSAPFGERDIIDPEGFRALFAGRRVMFVADHRSASDMLPTLIERAGPGCTVLVLGRSAPSPAPGPMIDLPPLPADAAQQALSAFGAPSDLAADLIAFAAGNPLLLRLVVAGARVVEPQSLARIVGELFAKSERDVPDEERKAFALLAGLWSMALRMPGPGVAAGSDVGGLPALLRSALWRLVRSPTSASRFDLSALPDGVNELNDLVDLGLLESLGPEIRLHPLLRAAVGTLPDDFAVFRDVDAPWCPELVALPAGEFLMGSPESEEGRAGDEGPQHKVTIGRRVALGRYPVTVAEYRKFVEATDHRHEGGIYVWTASEWKQDKTKSWRDPGFSQTDRHPVVGVSWRDAVTYYEWLTKETGKAYRLPSEAEWEYAARAGTTTRYSWGDAITPDKANYRDSKHGKTTEVGTYTNLH